MFYVIVVVLVLSISWFVVKHYRNNQVNLHWRLVVITGGSSGIGKSLAIECVKGNANVVIIARDESKMRAVTKELRELYLQRADQLIEWRSVEVSDRDAIFATVRDIEARYGEISVFMNCAGLAIPKLFEELNETDCRRMIDTNLYGTVYATQAIVEPMKRRGRGSIVIVGSVSSIFGIYGFSVYSATKFALRGLAEALHMELQQSGVSVTLCLPPDTNTPGLEQENRHKPSITKLISQSGGLCEPGDVAKQLLRDAYQKRFFSCVDYQSFALKSLAVGLSPFDSLPTFVFECCFLGTLRFLAVLYLRYVKSLISKVSEIQNS